jgi:release factor glutamine methyltransferase
MGTAWTQDVTTLARARQLVREALLQGLAPGHGDRRTVSELALEADLLIAYALRCSRLDLYREPARQLSPYELAAVDALLQRRLHYEPLAYILGQRDFSGLSFAVDARVLIPRPETETLVEAALAWARSRSLPGEGPAGAGLALADLGTGSGCVAVALAIHLPGARIIATDSSAEALEVARTNVRSYGLEDRITLLQADLYPPNEGPFDAVIANLPYVPDGEYARLPKEIREHEPPHALRGGPDGTLYLRRCIQLAPAHLRSDGALFLEFSPPQRRALVALARRTFPGATITVHHDLAKRPRVLEVVRAGDYNRLGSGTDLLS